MHIEFPAGTAEGVEAGSIERFAAGAAGVLFEADPGRREKWLLGAAGVILPHWKVSLEESERRILGVEQDGRCEVFCRASIPAENPSGAGFDFNRLILVCPQTGLALEKELSGQPFIPFCEACGSSVCTAD